MKNIRDFYLKIFSFLEVKFSMYLNRRVFVMCYSTSRRVHSLYSIKGRESLSLLVAFRAVHFL